ncbi:hypothetical protein AYI68_g6542 [Smittium mucronatum]|uniref:Uncharacterized protein n=1 Tax=Smittium mucronatum TaxID=133383 RepID=A0A1R0GR67_9FUNG|nr:hypothetical protein AYI68_g6542 [Smittium mucronatum]
MQRLNRAIGMVMHNHEFVESVAYPYKFAPEVEVWPEDEKYRGIDVSGSISNYVPALGNELDKSATW